MSRDGPRPPSARRPVEVLRLKAGHIVYLRFLGPLRGLGTHYTRSGSVPCPGEGVCPQRLHASRRDFKGYAPAEAWDQPARLWSPVVIEATSCLEEQLRGRDLRGEVWMLQREDRPRRSGRVSGVYCERHDDALVSPAFDVAPVVARYYGGLPLCWVEVNPMPPRLNLAPAIGPAPTPPAGLEAPEAPPMTESERDELRERARKAGLLRPRKQTAPSANGRPPDGTTG